MTANMIPVVKADLSALTDDGLLQALRSLLRRVDLAVGARVVVRDLFGSEQFPATVRLVMPDRILLDVDWETEANVVEAGAADLDLSVGRDLLLVGNFLRRDPAHRSLQLA